MLRSHRRGRRFEPYIPHHFFGGIAQLGARLLRMQKAGGSNPPISTKKYHPPWHDSESSQTLK